jgi:hypothetical protein
MSPCGLGAGKSRRFVSRYCSVRLSETAEFRLVNFRATVSLTRNTVTIVARRPVKITSLPARSETMASGRLTSGDRSAWTSEDSPSIIVQSSSAERHFRISSNGFVGSSADSSDFSLIFCQSKSSALEGEKKDIPLCCKYSSLSE